ncbi:CGNR zinc finger domain-containing protein [Actinoallomurus acaciae]|uniref:CGNR zinc finger domain-containing protein n=1 Tax=Actinoallomurus acaciae TaxID=502577 RepID=A0ABV5YU22_9ACTN
MGNDEVVAGAVLLGEPLPVELMNTVGVGRQGVHDALEDDAGVAAWLRAVGDRVGVAAGAPCDGLDEDAVRPVSGRVRSLRDALRRLASEMTSDPRPPATAPELTRPDAVTALNAFAGTWPELVWPSDGPPSRAFRSPDGPADLAIALIAHQGVELFAGAQRRRLRACLAPNCLLFFVAEHARREWCSALCGNRARVARHYHRHR